MSTSSIISVNNMLSYAVRGLVNRPVTRFSTCPLDCPHPPMSRAGRPSISKSLMSSHLPLPRSSISPSFSRMLNCHFFIVGFTESAPWHRTPVSNDHQNRTVMISPLWINTGEPHPLASRSKLETIVSDAALRNLSDAMVLGDYVLYWVGASISETHTLCNIYLVAWKEGWISNVCICPTLMQAKIETTFFC